MQNIKRKIPGLIILTLLLFLQVAKGQDTSRTLEKADSLFEQRRFTQSLELYRELFVEHETYSPQMLLKMAYINEGLGNVSKALYYLNTYYLKTSDQNVLSKMESLAEKHNLYGYEFTDTDLLLNYYNKYFTETILIALAVCLFLFALMFYQKRKQQSPVFPGIALLVALLLVAYMANSDTSDRAAIINKDTAYLMNGPSSGADVAEIVKKGHRVNILGQEDVWTKILWNGEAAYIRKSHLMVLD